MGRGASDGFKPSVAPHPAGSGASDGFKPCVAPHPGG